MAGLLVIMGSGETAPTMVKAHRAIFERAGDAPAVLLDATDRCIEGSGRSALEVGEDDPREKA